MGKQLLFLILVWLLANRPYKTYSQDTGLAAAIKNNAWGLTTAEPTAPGDDLAFLSEILDGKTVVALGEATHGTKEFFDIKHRIIRYLVEKMGYRVFAVEANLPECEAINQYVMYGTGDAVTALRGIYFWTWNTTEVLDMIEWMRQYNMGKPDSEKVQFCGFDMQYVYGGAMLVKQELDKAGISYNEYKPMLDSFTKSVSYRPADTNVLNAAYARLQQFNGYANSYRQQYIQSSSEKAYELHMQHIAILLQAVENRILGDDGYRDSCMAVNVQWIGKHLGTDKMVLWAHNGHVSKWKMQPDADHYAMGWWLSHAYGNKYYAAGFDFGTGTFRAKKAKYIMGDPAQYPVTAMSISKIAKGSTSYYFHQTGLPLFYLDHKKASASSGGIKSFLSHPHPQKSIGAIYWPAWESDNYFPTQLDKCFDATIYADHTTATVPVPGFESKK